MITLLAQAATETRPAGGAAIGEVILATGGATIATMALLALGWGHRTGRTTLLKRVADPLSRATGLPPWAALPTILSTGALLVALVGMYWDISLHIDDGRDEGPLANPAHYLILIGLFGIFAAGFLAMVLPEGRPSRAAVRITEGWYAPVGGICMAATAGFALTGFPLDDVWHRLFGQDVTLWGPTHLMLIGGAGLTLIGQAMLYVEGGKETEPAQEPRGLLAMLHRQRHAAVCGGLLIGLCTFQAEFDFGVPQFRLLFHPVLIAAAAGIALTAARIYGGPGGALLAAVYFLVIRGLVSLLVGPGFDETLPVLPLFLVEAAMVELAARAIHPRRAIAFGALAGGLIGTVGFLAEYGWAQFVFPVEWPAKLLAEGALVVPLTGIAAGVIGAFVGCGLTAPRRPEEIRMPRIAPAAVSAVVIAAVIGYGLQTEPVRGVTASVALEEVTPAPDRTVNATVRVDPPSATSDPDWMTVIGWQGRDKLHLDHLKEVGDGVWRTTQPIPVHGTWKALVRLHDGSSIAGIPIFLPEDAAIPAKEVPATSRFERTFVADKEILQREAKDDVPASLPVIGYLVVGGIAFFLIAVLAWALARVGNAASGGVPPSRRRRRGSAARPAAAA